MELAWDDPDASMERTVDAHVKNLRQKIEPDPKQPRYLLTVYGVGYRLAELLPLAGVEKQHLLELTDPIERLQNLVDVLPRFQTS